MFTAGDEISALDFRLAAALNRDVGQPELDRLDRRDLDETRRRRSCHLDANRFAEKAAEFDLVDPMMGTALQQ